MLNKLLTKQTIQIVHKVTDWKAAIRLASTPLVENGSVNTSYVEAMIDNVVELGPYIVIAPQIALPHARPEQGVNLVGMSMLCLDESVSFSDKKEHDVRLLVVLAAVDNESHLQALMQLSELLSEPKAEELIMNATKVEQVLDVINEYTN